MILYDYIYTFVYTIHIYLLNIKGLRPLPPTPVERMDRGSLSRTSTTELPAPTPPKSSAEGSSWTFSARGNTFVKDSEAWKCGRSNFFGDRNFGFGIGYRGGRWRTRFWDFGTCSIRGLMPWGRIVYVFKLVSVLLVFFVFKLENGHR